MSDFPGYKKIETNKEPFEGYKLEEGRPKLIKFKIKKNKEKWSIKNLESGKGYFIKIDNRDPENSMHSFLTSTGAFDEFTFPRTDKLVDYIQLVKELFLKGELIVWIPANRIDAIKKTWSISNETPTFKFKDALNIKKD